jgi:hypothetical protein
MSSHATWFDDVVIEVDVDREAVFLLQVFQGGVEEDDDVFVEIDRLVLVPELGIEGDIVSNHRLNLADGLAPMNLVVAAGIDNRNVREEILMLFVEAEHRKHHVEERLVGVALVGDDVLNLGVLNYAAVFVPGVVALDGLVKPDGQREDNLVEAVFVYRILRVVHVDDVLRPIFAESHLVVLNFAFAGKEKHLRKDKHRILCLLRIEITYVRHLGAVQLLAEEEVSAQADLLHIRQVVGIFFEKQFHRRSIRSPLLRGSS